MPSTPNAGSEQAKDVSHLLGDYSEKMRSKAHKLALAALSSGMTPEGLADAAASVEQAADIQVQRYSDKIDLLHKEGRMPEIACKKGCWFCCGTQVMATIPEVLRLARWIQENFSETEITALKERILKHAERVFAVRTSGERRPPIMCPILVDGACSAHPGRPIACRGANSFSVDACIRAYEDWQGEHDIPLVTQTYYAGKAMVQGLREAAEQQGVASPLVEMPLALHIALSDPAAGQRHIAGEPVFEAAGIHSSATAFASEV